MRYVPYQDPILEDLSANAYAEGVSYDYEGFRLLLVWSEHQALPLSRLRR